MTERLILDEKFVTSRGLGLPTGTTLLLQHTDSGVTVVDYTTPHGAYGEFITLDSDELIRIRVISREDIPTRTRRGRGRSRRRGR
jgi:hypothetical protein